jgi:hypothetical protein
MKSIQYAPDNENPISPATVTAVDTITIHFVSNLRMSRGLSSDEKMVIKQTSMETYPA